MNLDKLFAMQKALDNRITKKKSLVEQNLFPLKRLALLVELGELANEWRGFKFWSNNQEPRTEIIDRRGETANEYYKNPLLEEYVDCLHFILSIGNDIHCKAVEKYHRISLYNDTTRKFNTVFKLVSGLDEIFLLLDDTDYQLLFNEFLELGEQIGFTWEQIEQAYYDKNAINHNRQSEGY